jgi:hypothetical protein
MKLTRHKIPARELAIDNLEHSEYDPEIACPMAYDCRDGFYECTMTSTCSYCKDRVPPCYWDASTKLCYNCS